LKRRWTGAGSAAFPGGVSAPGTNTLLPQPHEVSLSTSVPFVDRDPGCRRRPKREGYRCRMCQSQPCYRAGPDTDVSLPGAVRSGDLVDCPN
jgi:hypothetical protein